LALLQGLKPSFGFHGTPGLKGLREKFNFMPSAAKAALSSRDLRHD
jgi:hypothetical protein